MPETYAKTFRESVLSKLRYGKVERFEYGGRTTNNVAGEVFIEGKLNQRLFFPLNTVAYVHIHGAFKDSAGSPIMTPFKAELRIARPTSGTVVVQGTGAANAVLFQAVDNAGTAVTAIAVSIVNNEEVRFTYTGAAASGVNLIRFRLNVVSVCTDSDVVVS